MSAKGSLSFDVAQDERFGWFAMARICSLSLGRGRARVRVCLLNHAPSRKKPTIFCTDNVG